MANKPISADPDLAFSSVTAPIAVPPAPTELANIEGLDEPTFKETFQAVLRQDTMIGAMSNPLPTVGNPIKDVSGFAEYDVYSKVPDRFKDYAGIYAAAQSDEDVDLITARLEEETHYRDVLDRSGIGSQMLAGLPFAVPGMIIGAMTGFGAVAAGASVFKGITTAGAVGGGLSGLSEAFISGHQYIRPAEESMAVIGASTILSGMFGGAFAAATKPVKGLDNVNKVMDRYERDANLEPYTPEELSNFEQNAARSVGSAQVEIDPELSKLSNTGGVASALKWLTPQTRTLTSEAHVTRTTSQLLVGTGNLRTLGNEQGFETAESVVEMQIRDAGHRASVAMEVDDLFHEYRTGKVRKRGSVGIINAKDAISEPADKLTHTKFLEAVSDAMDAGDVHDIPEVAKAAKLFREKIYNRRLQQIREAVKNPRVAAELKITPEMVEDMAADASYLTRVWNPVAINSNRLGLRAEISRYIASLDGNINIKDDADYLNDVASQVIDKILGNHSGRIDYDLTFTLDPDKLKRSGKVKNKSQFIKERHLKMPNQNVKEWTVRDAGVLMRRYDDGMAGDLALVKQFKSVEMSDELGEIRRFWDEKIEAAEKAGEKTNKLSRRKNSDIKDLMAMRDMIRGRYNLPADPHSFFHRAANNVILPVNYMRLLGGVGLSSTTDLGKIVMQHGLSPVIGRGLKKMALDSDINRLANKDLARIMGGTQRYVAGRQQKLGELSDNFGLDSKLERGIAKGVNVFTDGTLMNEWNDGAKFLAGWVSQGEIMDAVKRVATNTAKRGDVSKLAKNGINKGQTKKILELVKRHGKELDNNEGWLLSTQDWVGDNARFFADKVETAILRDIEATILTPRAGAKSLWVSTDVGRLIGQFRSFGFSSITNTTMAAGQGLMRGDIATLNGLGVMVGMGSLIYMAKAKLAGREIDYSVENLIAEGIDRSGALGILTDFNAIIEKGTRGRLGMSAAFGAPPLSRNAAKGLVGAIIGPTGDLIEKSGMIAGDVMAGDVSSRTTRAAQRMAPGNNIFWFQNMSNMAREGIEQQFGIEPPKQ